MTIAGEPGEKSTNPDRMVYAWCQRFLCHGCGPEIFDRRRNPLGPAVGREMVVFHIISVVRARLILGEESLR